MSTRPCQTTTLAVGSTPSEARAARWDRRGTLAGSNGLGMRATFSGSTPYVSTSRSSSCSADTMSPLAPCIVRHRSFRSKKVRVWSPPWNVAKTGIRRSLPSPTATSKRPSSYSWVRIATHDSRRSVRARASGVVVR